jgi:hypothetical protein
MRHIVNSATDLSKCDLNLRYEAVAGQPCWTLFDTREDGYGDIVHCSSQADALAYAREHQGDVSGLE